MFAVRNIFSRPERLAATVRELADAGELPRELADDPDPLGFLVHEGGASSVIDAAYRFVRHEPGVDVVLFGTGDIGHLRTNINSLLKPPLPEADRDRLAGAVRASRRGRARRAAPDAAQPARRAAAERPRLNAAAVHAGGSSMSVRRSR